MSFVPVSVSLDAFRFCRLGVMVLLWVTLLLRSVPLLAVVFLILFFSALLGVGRAPMIWLYAVVERRFRKKVPSRMLDRRAMRFAHSLGSVFAAVCLVLVLWGVPSGWSAVFLFAVLKSVSAFGFCPADRLYRCMTGSSCCGVFK